MKIQLYLLALCFIKFKKKFSLRFTIEISTKLEENRVKEVPNFNRYLCSKLSEGCKAKPFKTKAKRDAHELKKHSHERY